MTNYMSAYTGLEIDAAIARATALDVAVTEAAASAAATAADRAIVEDIATGGFTARGDVLTPIIAASTGVPNISTTAHTITFPVDTLVMVSNVSYRVDTATAVDLMSVASDTKLIYMRLSDKAFIVRDYNDPFSDAESRTFVLLAVLRYTESGVAYAAMNCPYTVDGQTLGAESCRSWATIWTPYNAGAVTAATNYPDYDTATGGFTLFKDTILEFGNTRKVLSSTTVIDTTVAASTATQIFWDMATDTLVCRKWSVNLTASERRTFVQVAAIRNSGVSGVPPVLSLICPYTIDGDLFGQPVVVENKVGAAVEGIHHRGFSSVAPENTIAAYMASATAKNYTVEGDIQWSSDGVPVIIHDSTVDRTTNGTGTVVSKTLAQLQALDAGSWKSAAYAGEQIPTFEALLRLAKRLDLFLFMETKVAITLAQAQTLIALVKKTGMVGRIEFDSFRVADLLLIVGEDPAQRVGLLGTMSEAHVDSAVTLLTGSNRVSVSVEYTGVTESLMDYARSAGIGVSVWTVDTAVAAATVAGLGVDGIMTNVLNVTQVLRDYAVLMSEYALLLSGTQQSDDDTLLFSGTQQTTSTDELRLSGSRGI